MKKWEKPEVKVFSVKMDENIAASGEGRYIKTVNFNPGGDIQVYVNGQIIVDTNIGWYMDGDVVKASNAYQQGIGSTGDYVLNGSSCRV